MAGRRTTKIPPGACAGGSEGWRKARHQRPLSPLRSCVIRAILRVCKPQRRGLRIRRGISAEANRADQIRHEEPLEFGCGVRFHMGFVRTTSGVISAGNGGEKRLPQPFLLLLGMSVKRSFVVVSDDLKGRAFRGRRTAHGRCKEAGTLGSLSRVSVKPCRSWSRCRKASDRATPFYEKATPSQTSLLIENLIGKGCSEVPEELLGLVEPFPLNLGLLQILINPFKQPLAAQ